MENAGLGAGFDAVHNCLVCKVRDKCPLDRSSAEEQYRRGIIVSACSLHWYDMFRLHRILRKLQKRYESYEDARADPKAAKLFRVHDHIMHLMLGDLDVMVQELEEFKSQRGHYPGMDGTVFRDDKRTETDSNLYR
jgi:hypothetical protein